MLRLENITLGAALCDVSLTVENGEIVAVRGAARDVLLRIAAGVERPEAGCVKVGGRCAVVNDLWPSMGGETVVDQLALPLLEEKSIRRSRAMAVRYLIEHGAQEWAALDVRELGGSDRARLAVLRALIVEPDVVLAEDPAAVEDEIEQGAIIDLLRMAARNGASVLITAASVRALAAAHRVLKLSRGSLSDPLTVTTAQVINFPRARGTG